MKARWLEGPPREERILPCTFHPCEGELLTSWLVRLAGAHRIKVQSFCQYLWPGLVLWKRDVDKLAPAVVLETLAARTLTPAKRILQTTLAPIGERLTGASLHTGQGLTPWLMPVSIYHRTHLGYGLTYCPSCLQQDGPTPYFRVYWRLAFHVVCLRCGSYLQEGCPACGAPVNFFRLDVGLAMASVDRPLSSCYRCGVDVSTAPAMPASPLVLNRYHFLFAVSQEGWCPAVPYPHQYFQVLRQLVRVLSCPFGRAQALQAGIRRRLNQPEEWHTSGGAFEQLPLRERSYLLEQALWLLEEWPGRFIEVMQSNNIKSYTIFRDLPGDLPFWFSRVVHEYFYISRVTRRFTSCIP